MIVIGGGVSNLGNLLLSYDPSGCFWAGLYPRHSKPEHCFFRHRCDSGVMVPSTLAVLIISSG
jgi:hypothetical protein